MQIKSPTGKTSSHVAFSLDIAKLVSGTVIAQIIAFILTPIITRIFIPEIYGLYTTFISFATIIITIAFLRYEESIILPKHDSDAASLMFASLIFLLIIDVILLLLLIFFGESFFQWYGIPQIYPLAIYLPLYILVYGLFHLLRQWNTRNKRFKLQATTQVIQTITDNVAKLSMGFAGFIQAVSLMISSVLGYVVGGSIIGMETIKHDLAIFKKGFNLKNIKAQIIRYKKFPLIASWSALLNVVSWNLPVVMLAPLFSTAVAGFYSLGFTIIQIPISLISASIGQVFKQRCSVAIHDNSLTPLVEEVMALLIMLSPIPFIFLMFFGGDAFGLVFGNKWIEAGMYAAILAPFGLTLFIIQAICGLTSVLEIQEIELIADAIILPLRFISLMIGAIVGDVYLALTLYMISSVGGFVFLGFMILRKAHASLRHIWNKISRVLPLWIIFLGVMVVLSVVGAHVLLVLAISAVAGAGYYLVLVKKSKLVRQYLGVV